MSDILHEAEALADGMADCPDFSDEQQMNRRLVSEDKRLREDRRELLSDNVLTDELAAKDSLNNDLMVNCNQLRDRCWKVESELSRWRQIAIEERFNYLDLCDAQYYPNGDRPDYRAQAAKELQLEATNDAEYLIRLEREFLSLKEKDIRENGPFFHTATITGQTTPFDLKKRTEMAQAALSKIREGN